MPHLSFTAWRGWFIRAATLALDVTPEDGVTIFYQTDVKRAGAWVDKAFLCQLAADSLGAPLLWHKIVCRRPAGTITYGRPAYAHLLAFSRRLEELPSDATADVLPELGAMTWSRAIGLTACRFACRFVRERTRSTLVVDPFCGVGTVLAVANELGLDAIGVELSAKRARKARRLTLEGASPGC